MISFDNIDAFKRNVDHLNRYAAALIENARDATLVLDSNLHVVSVNQAFQRRFEVSAEETENRPIYDLGNGQWNIPRLRELWRTSCPIMLRVQDFEVHHDFPHLGPRTMMVNARRIEPQAGRQLILLYIEDVTQRPKQNV